MTRKSCNLRIIYKLERLAKLNPELRFWQLIALLTNEQLQYFYEESAVTLKKIEEIE